MIRIKILIIEDELIIAEDMKEMLIDLHYEVIGIACNHKETEEILAQDVPDVALIDIKLRRGEDGIALGRMIKNDFGIPVIFVTSHADHSTIERAKQVNPEGYIVKPFKKDDLYTSVEIALFNHAPNNRPNTRAGFSENAIINDSIFIRKDYMLVKIKFEDLLLVKTDNNYLELHCKENKHLIRSTLKEFVDKLPSTIFLQVHKCYCINTACITAIDYNSVWINEMKIPIGRSHIDSIKKVLNIDLWPKSL